MQPRRGDIALRVGAGLAACALLLPALLGTGVALMVVAFAAQAPDAFGIQGELCCAPPQTWREVLLSSALAVPFVVVATGLWAIVASLVRTVVSERGLPRRWVARLPLRALACLAVLLPVCWLADEPVLRADCATFTVRADDWLSDDERDRWRSAEAIDRCDMLDGMSQNAVRRSLGPPDTRRGHTWIYWNAAGYNSDSGAGHLRVVLRAGRVVRAGLQ